MALDREYDHLIDEMSHLLAIKAFIASIIASQIRPTHVIASKAIIYLLSNDLSRTHSLSMELRNTTVESHDYFGDVSSTLRTFQTIHHSQRDALAVINIMESLINNHIISHQHQNSFTMQFEYFLWTFWCS